MSLIEAAALGLPIVSTNVGGIPFLFEDRETALLVPPNNVDKMTKAVNTLLIDSCLAVSITKKARERMELYDWAKVKGMWLSLLRQ